MVFCRFHDRSSHSKFIFIQSGFRADWAYWLSTHINQKHNVKYTFSDGCLGSHNDEERSEMRYVMRIAESSESSKLWTHLALPFGGVCLLECLFIPPKISFRGSFWSRMCHSFVFFKRGHKFLDGKWTNLTFVYSIRNNVLFTERYYSNIMTMRRHILWNSAVVEY
jgi:hypothetical protein